MFECSNCFAKFQKWLGKCSNCGNWNSLEEISSLKKSLESQQNIAKQAFSMDDIASSSFSRILSTISEWDNVLGGGIIPGSVLILTGDPGVGKSTLILQISDKIASQNKKSLYISSEESLAQLKQKITTLNLLETKTLFCEENDIESILATIKNEKPTLAIIDSIQNCCLKNKNQNSTSSTFGISAIKEAVHEVVCFAKKENIAIIMTGHITKDGSLAGPKILEHLVDGVFYLQDDTDMQRKILSSVKNRFGTIDELGFFEMTDKGFQEITDINQKILTESNAENSFGTSLFLSFRGSRCILSEFQALCVKTKSSIPQRIFSGVDPKKVLIICALLEKYLKVELSSCDLFLKTKGGTKISENYADLAIACSILSSYFKIPMLKNLVAIGELNLSGKISNPCNIEKILKSAKKMGLEKIVCAKDSTIEQNIKMLAHVYNLLELFPQNKNI